MHRSEISDEYDPDQWSALTHSPGFSLEFQSYVAAMCGLTLMLALVVGAVGFAGISRAFRAAAGVASGAYLAPVKQAPMPRQ